MTKWLLALIVLGAGLWVLVGIALIMLRTQEVKDDGEDD
jgi:hypothetical protein